MLVAMFGILAVLVLEFGSFRSTLIVAGVIPLGIIGGLVALFLTGNTLSFTAMIGFDRADRHRDQELDPAGRLHQPAARTGRAARRRDRAGRRDPLPADPADLGDGDRRPAAARAAGLGLYSPLAIVIIGGLISSTLLARLVTPVMYKLLPPSIEPRKAAALASEEALQSA